MYIGTAAWSLPRDVAAEFPGDGQQLERYARQFACVEINSSFYKPHRIETYARWAGMTPPHFRFAVKLPRAITHDARLRATRQPLNAFLAETVGLGDRLGVLLAQLPPSLPFEARVARTFFALLRESWAGPVACEPRHASWFEPAADRALEALRVTRVATDPARGRAVGWGRPATAPGRCCTTAGTARRACTGRATTRPGCSDRRRASPNGRRAPCPG